MLISSCKKEKDSQNQNQNNNGITTTIPKIKTQTNGTFVTTHIYDEKGRIIQRLFSNKTKEEYTYNGSTILYKEYDTSNNIKLGTTIELNADGLITKETLTFPTTISFETTYAYNSNKQVVLKIAKNISKNKITTESYFYTEKNLDSTHTSFSNNSDFYRYFPVYYEDKLNTLSNTNMGFMHLAEISEHPIKKETYIYKTSAGITTQINDYVYIHDSNNRIIQRELTLNAYTTANTYTYY